MAFVMRYGWSVNWVGPNGVGQNVGPEVQSAFGAQNGQKLTFFDAGGLGSTTFTSTDIANFVTAMQADMTTQMNAQSARIQNFASGGG